jgi:O-methyltransferase involved in polyketide biosynthesis
MQLFLRSSGMSTSARISPTAHFTGYVWYRHGLGDPALQTRAGRFLVTAFSPIERAARWVGGPNLEDVLLSRHRLIDELLDAAIASGEIDQVLEVAAGLSPRGLRFTRRYGDRLRYVEGDLPGMVRRKRDALDEAARRDRTVGRIEVVPLDALTDGGPGSLIDVAERHLDPSRGLAIVTEGLVNYFDRGSVEAMWRRFAQVLGRHPRGLYLSDLHVSDDMKRVPGARAFSALLSVFARGRVHLHYRDEAEAGRALLAAGFAEARIHPAGTAPVRIVEAHGVTPRDP